jgi:hypothetical protein
MTRKHEEARMEEQYMGFEIRELDGWYVGVPTDPGLWRLFEAESRNVLIHKIRRWRAAGV